MKKIFLSLAIFSLVFVFGSASLAADQGQGQGQSQGQSQGQGQGTNKPAKPAKPAKPNQPDISLGQDSGLEKISNPAEISLFEKIKKIGTALWGIKKDNAQNGSQNSQAGAGLTASSTLEKISNPAEISLFEKIKKIGTALWGIRKNNNNQKPNSNQSKPVYVTPEAAQCVKDAINKKDTALKASTGNHDQKALAAIDVRGGCQKTALDQTTAQSQFDANKVCVEAFLGSIKEINEAMSKEKSEARKTYTDDLKSCSALQGSNTSTSASQTLSTEIIIEDGGDTVEALKQ